MAQMAGAHLPRTSGARLCTPEGLLPACLVSIIDFTTVNHRFDSLLERNMYLAEDRILCFEIVTKKHEGWM